MITNQKPPLEAAYLAHFGVKGMKWGVRREQSRSGTKTEKQKKESRLTPEQRERFKKVAIGFGALLVAAGSIYAIRSLNKGPRLPASRIRPSAASKKATEAIFKEPTSIIHNSRGKNAGFQFLKTGGTPTPYAAWEKAGFTPEGGGDRFDRLADGKIAARFYDPLGRKDRAGRAIPHEVIIPRAMSSGVNSLDDVKSKIWPTLKPLHDVMYDAPAHWRPGQGD